MSSHNTPYTLLCEIEAAISHALELSDSLPDAPPRHMHGVYAGVVRSLRAASAQLCGSYAPAARARAASIDELISAAMITPGQMAERPRVCDQQEAADDE